MPIMVETFNGRRTGLFMAGNDVEDDSGCRSEPGPIVTQEKYLSFRIIQFSLHNCIVKYDVVKGSRNLNESHTLEHDI